jgi:hypothetical protein
MSNRRDFLKHSAIIGAAALSPMAVYGNQTVQVPSSSEPVPATDKGDTYTVNMRTALRIPSVPARQITIPDVGEFKVLKGDFHIHTLFSDGLVMPGDRITEAVRNGFDVIAITDHIEYRPFFSKGGRWKLNDEQGGNFNLWYDIAKPEADKNNLLLIRGAEITKGTMPPGHFNALFTADNNPIAAVVNDWREMLRVAADQGAFLLWNHPGWEAPKSGGIEKGAPLRFTDAHEDICRQGLMHGIEVYNGAVDECYPIVSDWCNERNLAIFASSDIHPSESNKYGLLNPLRPVTLVLAKERSIDSIREAFFAKRTIAWAAGMIWGRDPWLPELFKASVEIKTVTPGTLEMINKSSLPISVSLGGLVFDLPKDAKQQVYRAKNVKTLTVANWMVAMNKPLEIPLAQ